MRLYKTGSLEAKTPIDRLSSKYMVDDSTGCWNWLAYINSDGYGMFKHKGMMTLAHKASYELLVKSVPDGFELDHVCHNRKCVNPKHLRVVNWHLPYIESPELHLAYQFLDLAGPKKLKDMAVLYLDDKHIAYTGQRGVMLYFHRSAIEKVGGFDPVYGRGMYEHPDLALRIHNAGLCWAAMIAASPSVTNEP